MYVLVSPCICDPTLRADGITRDDDLRAFAAAVDRCQEFGVEAVPLPCTETAYLGRPRAPGPYRGRLDTPEFAAVCDEAEREVRDLIARRGPPVCIVGVNSSPTCGVDRWYETDDVRREGRGAFLARFPDIPAIDVLDFARYRVYLAAPLFSEAERDFNRRLADVLEEHWFRVHLPQETGDSSPERMADHTRAIFDHNLAALAEADLVVAVIDGADADSGTAWEMGYASAMGIPVFAVRTDFRHAGRHERVNLMLEESSVVTGAVHHLPSLMKSPLSL